MCASTLLRDVFFPQTESNHDTALTLACAGGHEELVSVLIARGANIEHRDKKGMKGHMKRTSNRCYEQ